MGVARSASSHAEDGAVGGRWQNGPTMDATTRADDLTVVEICAGAGGQSLGLHRAGFRHTLAVELDADAAATLELNLKRLARDERHDEPAVRVGDVADESVWNPADHQGVSLLAGGVPCPPFSIAGNQLGSSDERDLFAWAVEAAGKMRPDAVLLENVRGLSMPRFAGYRQAVLDRFTEFGYVADWRLVEAKDFGVPQLRPRFILVALREEFAPYFTWPEPHSDVATVGETLVDLMGANGWRGAEKWAARADRVAPTIVGGSKKHGGPDLGPTRAKRAWAALGVDGMGVANEAPGRDMPTGHIPKLTNEMVARIQGWGPPDYEWDFRSQRGRKTATYRQIGNAFPPPVAHALGRSIASALRKERQADPASKVASELHDPVYRALRHAEAPVSVAELRSTLGSGFSDADLRRRLEFLGKDFDIEHSEHEGEVRFRLGEWRAFRGQHDHARHEAFAVAHTRSRIS